MTKLAFTFFALEAGSVRHNLNRNGTDHLF